ncbi:PepSY-associated TM helix domain-containing protein [Tsuneonella sp. CC-YZS046]|uniref:PepSY-associated TM helix domain-containing protein n=1 Tax=Tsuneonella sp. CC-YZS046 TaxID=3042152 RepID=UPI002D77A68C|nr:PepSY-associated TM helix domain-containing protein [Tsuneonella sp. CC-YZS046]WRO66375.1 PepSY-associated TM helix domain-containing protein [Tsuneonella sp. CC-YZS046]
MSAPANPDDPGGLRLALNWFHTWFGLFVGGLLFVIFWTGTLAVFDREIDRWMMPATRLVEAPAITPDALVPIARELAPDARSWTIILPDERTPVAQILAERVNGPPVSRYIDPATLRALPDQGTYGGTRFFYPYHYRLNSGTLAMVLCALAAVVMVALCISGVIIHRRIFMDFFTLRIVRKPQRTTLDLHNISGVLALPFHLMIAFTGVAIFTYTYLPSAQMVVFASDPAAASGGWFNRAAANAAGGPLVSLDAVRDMAAERWGGDRPEVFRVIHPGDANAYVEVQRPSGRTISYRSGTRAWFDGASGEFLAATPYTGTTAAYEFLFGIHAVQFDHWALRWLYFLSGLAGCALIATGLLFWVQSRRKRHEKLGLRGVRLTEAAAVGITTGLLIATLAFLIANRLLPAGIEDRAAAEVRIFHAAWIAAVFHAFLRGRAAWGEQAWAIAAGSAGAVLLNAVTTGHALPVAAARGLWHTAGVDLVLLAAAVIAACAAIRLGRVTGGRKPVLQAAG